MKMTTSRLRQIIREEAVNERLRKIIRESVRKELLREGFFGDLKDVLSATFTGKVDGEAVPEGVKKSDWATIIGQSRKAKTSPISKEIVQLKTDNKGKVHKDDLEYLIPETVDEMPGVYIGAMVTRVKGGEGIMYFEDWAKEFKTSLEDEIESRRSRRKNAYSKVRAQAAEEKELARQAASAREYKAWRAEKESESNLTKDQIQQKIDVLNRQIRNAENALDRLDDDDVNLKDKLKREIREYEAEIDKLKAAKKRAPW